MFLLSEKYQKDPFRLFFPLGFLLGVLGVLPWVALLFNWSIYPLSYHRMVMIGGFLTSFITGFLMTAVPRFTQTYHAKAYEIAISFVSILISYVFAAIGNETLFYFMLFIAHFNVLIFAAKRFLRKKSNPPPTFVLIGVSFIIWTLSDVALLLYSLSIIQDANWYLLFKNLWEEAAVLGLILGIGSRLAPSIMGWSEIQGGQKNVSTPLIIVITLFIFSYFVETFFNVQLGLILRGSVICFFTFRFWKIYKLPNIKSKLTIGIWLSAWCFLIGYAVRSTWISGGVHALHIIFIGGFSLLTFMIATRVTLAHSMTDLSAEKKSKALLTIIFLILFAALTRVLAIVWPSTYFHHLGYAALLWVIAVIVWLIKFFKILVCNQIPQKK